MLLSSVFGIPVSTTYEDNGHYGCGQCQAPVECKLENCERDGARLDIDFSGLRHHRIFDGEIIYLSILGMQERKMARKKEKRV